MTIQINLVAADGATSSITVADPTVNSAAVISFYGPTVVPATPDAGDGSAVTLGRQFSAAAPGNITGVGFYKSAANVGPHVGALYDTSGNVLAQANFVEPVEASSQGWLYLTFATPVAIQANTTYIAAYFTPSGHYAAVANVFASAVTVDMGLLSSPVGADIFAYGTALSFPNSGPYENDDYYIDVTYEQTGAVVPPPPPPATGPIGAGIFGPGTAANETAVEQTWLGMKPGALQDSGHGLAYDSWASFLNGASGVAQTAVQLGRRRQWVNVPPFPTANSTDGTPTLTQAASGAYNAHYAAIAGQWNNASFDLVCFRFMWEWTGGWYPWGYPSGSGQVNQSTYFTDFIGAFRQFVTAARGAFANGFPVTVQFCFSLAQGDQIQTPNWQQAWPGDDTITDPTKMWCHWLGMDWYDGNPGDNTTNPTARWAQDNEAPAAAALAFCQQHKVGFALPEWGVGRDGDNPLFVTNVRAALQAVQNIGQPVFQALWDSNYGGGNTDITGYPNSFAAYKSLFGGGQCT